MNCVGMGRKEIHVEINAGAGAGPGRAAIAGSNSGATRQQYRRPISGSALAGERVARDDVGWGNVPRF